LSEQPVIFILIELSDDFFLNQKLKHTFRLWQKKTLNVATRNSPLMEIIWEITQNGTHFDLVSLSGG